MTTPEIPPPPTQPHVLRNFGIIVIVSIAVLTSVLALGSYGTGGGGGILPSPHTVNIVNRLITVNSLGYEYYPFYVPSGATDVYVQGSFTASGGSGNDIEVLIMDSTEFINWLNEPQASAYYNSGQVTTSNFNVHLPSGSGTYYLVYSNKFSSTQKNVLTLAYLSYRR